jgi:hypothetical protein
MTKRIAWRWWFRVMPVFGLSMFVLAVTQYLDGRAWWRIAISLWLGVLLLFEWWRARRLLRRRGVDVSQP